jgi:hypothetical protein
MEAGVTIYDELSPEERAARDAKNKKKPKAEPAPTAVMEKGAVAAPPEPSGPGVLVVRVIKTAPNPRVAICEVVSGEGMEGKKLVVDVRKNHLFIPGMRFEAARAPGSSRFEWEYRGKLPRLRGRW